MTNKDILSEIINNFDSILGKIWDYKINPNESDIFQAKIKDTLKKINPELILKSWSDLLLKIKNSKEELGSSIDTNFEQIDRNKTPFDSVIIEIE